VGAKVGSTEGVTVEGAGVGFFVGILVGVAVGDFVGTANAKNISNLGPPKPVTGSQPVAVKKPSLHFVPVDLALSPAYIDVR